jgi:Na+-driven multidrug efflux pump
VWFQIPLALGNALAVRLGDTLPRSATFARKLVFTTVAVGTLVSGLFCLLLYQYRHYIYRIFIVNDPQIFEGCDEIWIYACLFIWQLSLFGINAGVAIGLGMQWILGAVTFLFLWVLGLPAAIYIGVISTQSLKVVWAFIYPVYTGITVVLWLVFFFKDWETIAQKIRLRESSKYAKSGILTEEDPV